MRFSTALVLAAAGLLPACGLNQQGVLPFADNIYFPGSALIDPSGRWLFVVNSNSDLRYNDGTLVSVDVNAAENDRVFGDGGEPWDNCPQVGYVHPHSDPKTHFCCWDQLDRSILNCDERAYIPPADTTNTVRIGSFGAGMVYQPNCDQQPSVRGCSPDCDPMKGRLHIGVRGNSSLTTVDVTLGNPPTFSCSVSAASFAECDASHEITDTTVSTVSLTNNPTPQKVVVPDEPYALALDPQLDLLYVGHLKNNTAEINSGGVSLFDVSNTSEPPTFVAPFPSIFPADVNGSVGVTALMVTPYQSGNALGMPAHELFVSSRYVALVGSMLPTTVPSCQMGSGPTRTKTTVNNIALIPASDTFNTTLVGSEDRGIQFITDANRAFVLQRVPPAVVGFDLSLDADGVRHLDPGDFLETCANPTFLDLHNPGGAGAQLYVTCFESGQLYVIDPYVPRVVNVIEVGRGPAGLAFGPSPAEAAAGVATAETTRAYVVGFGDNNISVVDLDPASPTRYHVIQRIGFASTVPR
jgi:YVTN family beta-propeller protein